MAFKKAEQILVKSWQLEPSTFQQKCRNFCEAFASLAGY